MVGTPYERQWNIRTTAEGSIGRFGPTFLQNVNFVYVWKLWKKFGECSSFFCPLNWPFFRGEGPFPRNEGPDSGPSFLGKWSFTNAFSLTTSSDSSALPVSFPEMRVGPSILGKGSQWISKLLDSIPEQDNTKFVVRQAHSILKLQVCDKAELLSTLLVAIKMFSERNPICTVRSRRIHHPRFRNWCSRYREW